MTLTKYTKYRISMVDGYSGVVIVLKEKPSGWYEVKDKERQFTLNSDHVTRLQELPDKYQFGHPRI